MRALWVALFFPVICVASSGHSGHESFFVDYPEACVKDKKFPCTIKSAKFPLQFESGEMKYSLDKESAIQLRSNLSVQLMQGKVWIQSAVSSELHVNPQLKLQFEGEIFCEKRKDQTVHIRNLNAEVSFDSKYVFKEESLPTGFENWYGSMAANGELLRGVIRPIDKEDFMKVWPAVAGSSLADLRKKLKQYLDLWSGTVEASAQMYQEITERRMASIREKEDMKLKAQRKRAEEQGELRRMYREKNGL